jgi:superfamily II DNA or RNA helicase
MSLISDVNDIPVEKVNKELVIKIEPKFGLGQTKYIHPYTLMSDNTICLPFAYATRVLKVPRPTRKSFPSTRVKFQGTLRPEQKIVRKEAVKCLNRRGSVIVSAYCGFGKTCMAVHMSTGIGFRTLIIVNKIILMKQWEESILRFCPQAIVHRVTAKSPKKTGDFYIMNAQNVEKKGKKFFSDVGLVIVDEAHMIMAETLSKSLQYVYPRYLIGLTATPYRPDGLDILLQLYFGSHKIIRKLSRKHVVYKVDTGFIPKVERTFQGRVNWGSILDQQANSVHRNEIIINIIEKYSKRNFLVLVKRVSQGKYLIKRLEEKGISVTNLIGSNQEFESSARVLVGTCQKIGTGFDHPKLNTLILGADIQEYFIQYLGRIFRIKDSEPMVFDLVDNNGILRKHYATRAKVYREHGGTIHPWRQ